MKSLVVDLFHVVDHEDDDAAGVEDENGDDVDECVALHLPPLLTGQSGRISTATCHLSCQWFSTFSGSTNTSAKPLRTILCFAYLTTDISSENAFKFTNTCFAS